MTAGGGYGRRVRIADVDPDEVGDRRQRWWWTVGVVGLLCLAVAIVMIAAKADDSSPDALPGTAPGTEPPSTVVTVPPVATTVPGFPGSGSDYMGAKLPVLAKRTTPTGIAMVLYRMTDFEAVSFQPSADVPDGWTPAPWCFPVSSYRLTSAMTDAISVSNGPLYAAGDEVRVMLHSGGEADGEPYRVMMVQAPTDTKSVAVRFGDGATDSAPVVDGYAVLGTPGAFHGKFTLTLTVGSATGDTQRVVDWSQIITEGSVRWQRACNPPPPGLPPPGPAQPADPAAARNLISSQFALLFQSGKPIDERLAAVDDSTGIAAAVDEVSSGQFSDAAANAAYVLGDIVFATPDQAWFQYSLAANGSTFTGRFGEANLIGGIWRISRATICQDLALAGGTCVPFVDPVNPTPVLPPVSGDT